MRVRNRYREVTVTPGEHSGVYWETRQHREEVLFFRVLTTEPISLIYVENISLGDWQLCAFRLPLESLLALLNGFPMWAHSVQLNLELGNRGNGPCTFQIRPVCAGDDADGAS
jgi:hypothetical protein